MCFGCGEDNPRGLQLGPLARIEHDEIRIDLEVEADFAGFEGVVHGGIIATILDEAMGLACTRVHHAQGAVTVKLDLAFHGIVKTNSPIKVRARSFPDGRKFNCTGEILDSTETVLATAASVWVIPSTSEG